MIPRAVGRYEVLRELGRGGMGVVYEGLDPGLGRRVALKVILAGGLDAAALARFEREARLLARVRHPAVVAVHGLERAGAAPVLVVDLVEGARPLEPGPMAPEEAARVVRDVADAVEAVHRAGVLHRDIKPANVVRRADGSVVLLDFGLARELDGSSLTRTGEVLGTPAFMAPEQVQGRAVDARVDVYGLGALLYALLVGAPPFEGGVVQVLSAVCTRDPVWPSQRAGTPAALDRIVRAAMARRPDDRPPTAAALRDAVDRWLAPAPAPRRSAAAGGVALAVVGVVGAVALAAVPRSPVTVQDAAPVTTTHAPPPEPPPAPPPDLGAVLLARARRGELPDDRWKAPLCAERPAGQTRALTGIGARVTFFDDRRLAVAIPGTDRLFVAHVGLELADGGARAGLAGQAERHSTDDMSSHEAGERSRRTHHTDDGGARATLAWRPLRSVTGLGELRRVGVCDGRLAVLHTGGLALVDPDGGAAPVVVELPAAGELATAGHFALVSDKARVWWIDARAPTPRSVMPLRWGGARVAMAITPDGRKAVVVEIKAGGALGGLAKDTATTLLELPDAPAAPTLVELDTFGHPPHKSAAITPDGAAVFGCDALIVEELGREPVKVGLEATPDRTYLATLDEVVMSPGGRVAYLCSGSHQKPEVDNELVAWSRQGAERRATRPHAMKSITVSPDGLLVAVGTVEETVEVWLAGDDVP